LFILYNLEHMHREETENNAALWAAFTDRELDAITAALVAQIPEEANALFLAWMVIAFNHAERVLLLRQMASQAPAQVYAAALSVAKEQLSKKEWEALHRDLPAG